MNTGHIRNYLMAAFCIGLGLFLSACFNDKSTPGIEDGIVHEDIRGECGESLLSGNPEFGRMVLTVLGNDLHIHHLDASYNCCMEYAVDYLIEDFDITATEKDTSHSPCLCDCYFNLKSILYGLEDGSYTATLIGVYGDTVGVDTATVGG